VGRRPTPEKIANVQAASVDPVVERLTVAGAAGVVVAAVALPVVVGEECRWAELWSLWSLETASWDRGPSWSLSGWEPRAVFASMLAVPRPEGCERPGKPASECVLPGH
jgi:hypothetical protein